MSRVTKAGNYTQPKMRKTYLIELKQVVKVVVQTMARKAQMLAKQYKS